jgi:hypothetical protein
MNQLKVNRQQSIVALFEQGWSKRRIARELALDRATVRKYPGRGDPRITHHHFKTGHTPDRVSTADVFREATFSWIHTAPDSAVRRGEQPGAATPARSSGLATGSWPRGGPWRPVSRETSGEREADWDRSRMGFRQPHQRAAVREPHRRRLETAIQLPVHQRRAQCLRPGAQRTWMAIPKSSVARWTPGRTSFK